MASQETETLTEPIERSVVPKKRYTTLLYQLMTCTHTNSSMMMETDRLQTCFDCGSTKRKDELEWVQPRIWRERRCT